MLGSFYTHNWLAVPVGGTLEKDRVAGAPDVRALLGDFGAHGVELAEVGLRSTTPATTRSSPAMACSTP